MPIDVGSTINSLTDSLLQTPVINTIATSPIYTALIITIIIVLIVLYIFRNTESDDSISVMSLRTGFWVFIMLLGVLCLHNKVIYTEKKSQMDSDNLQTIFNGSYDNSSIKLMEDSIVPVLLNNFN